MSIAKPTIAELFIDKMYEAGATLHVTVNGYRFRRWAEATPFRPKMCHSIGWEAYRFETFEPNDELKKLFKRNKYDIDEHCRQLVEEWIRGVSADQANAGKRRK